MLSQTLDVAGHYVESMAPFMTFRCQVSGV